ncbi:MAG: hypothetical protein WC603_03605 [Candidatus Paceibacterota bacterium]
MSNYPVASRVIVFASAGVVYEGVVSYHLPASRVRPHVLVIENGNQNLLTFIFFTRLDGTKGWVLVPNESTSGQSIAQTDPIYSIKKVELPAGKKRFSFVECTCPELENKKHGHIFDHIEGKNATPHIYNPKDARNYFKFLKSLGRIFCEDKDSIKCVLLEVRNYF